MKKTVCIIGGGISGLCAAYQLKKQGVEVLLLEKSKSAGGNIKSEIFENFLLEYGPNSVLLSPHFYELVTELGLTSEIAFANDTAKKRYVLKNGRLSALPMKVTGLLGNRTFSAKAKLRLLTEPFVKSKSSSEESISDFFRRRFGQEVVDYAVDPFISGIFAGNPDALSLQISFPKLYELEKNHGSLLKGAIFSPKDKKAKLPKTSSKTVSFKKGMQTLTDKLSEKSGESVKLDTEVFSIKKTSGGRFKIQTSDKLIDSRTFEAVVICTPSFAAAKLIKDFDNALAEKLEAVYYPPIAVVFSAFKKEYIKSELDGFGFLIPKIEQRKILGSLWNSVIFENRAPDGFHLLTTFVGGARNAELADQDENALINITLAELDAILGLSGKPHFTKVKKWEKAIPQYNLGYEKIINAIEDFKQQHGGIFFCSNFYKGISVSDCIKNSISASEEVINFLNQ